MNGVIRDLTLCFLASLGACAALAWAVPIARGSFQAHMKGRTIRFLGRMVLVLVLVAVAIKGLEWRPLAAAAGVLGGWLLSSGWEAWQCSRAGDDGK